MQDKSEKNHTCVKKGRGGDGTPQNFFLAFVDELEKQLFEKLLKWANKKQRNGRILIFTMLFFF